MGLDISAYERVTFDRTRDLSAEDEIDYGSEIFLYQPQDFAYGQEDGLCQGVYKITGRNKNFRAGSYSGYNEWRDILCKRAHGIEAEELWKSVDAFRGKPFAELIHFADNEGFIGPKTSSKLAEDFRSHAKTVKFSNAEHRSDEAYFNQQYDAWQAAFELAAGAGVVDFH